MSKDPPAVANLVSYLTHAFLIPEPGQGANDPAYLAFAATFSSFSPPWLVCLPLLYRLCERAHVPSCGGCVGTVSSVTHSARSSFATSNLLRTATKPLRTLKQEHTAATSDKQHRLCMNNLITKLMFNLCFVSVSTAQVSWYTAYFKQRPSGSGCRGSTKEEKQYDRIF